MLQIINVGKSLPIIRRMREFMERIICNAPVNVETYVRDYNKELKMTKVSSAFTCPLDIRQRLAKYGISEEDCNLAQTIGYLWAIPMTDIDAVHSYLEGYDQFIKEIAPNYWPNITFSCDFLTDPSAYLSTDEPLTYGKFKTSIEQFISNIENLIRVGHDQAISLKTLNTNKLIYFIERLEQTVENYSRVNNKLYVDISDVELHDINESCGTPGCHAGWIHTVLPEIQQRALEVVRVYDPTKANCDYDFSATAAAFSLWLFDKENLPISGDDAADLLEPFFPAFKREIWSDRHPNAVISGINAHGHCYPWSDCNMYEAIGNIFPVQNLIKFWKRVLDAAQRTQAAPANS